MPTFLGWLAALRHRRLIILAVIAAAAVPAAGLLGLTLLSSALSAPLQPAAAAAGPCGAAASPQAPAGEWDAEQMTNAATIASAGAAAAVPQYGWVIAVATAMQESSLVNLDHGDRDSLGLFQQRPSQGWGTPAQIMNPVFASGQFYRRLDQVPGWQRMTLDQAAQSVQRSGTPGAYAKWQAQAAAVVSRVTGAAVTAAAPAATCQGGGPAAGSPGQLAAAVAYAYAALGTLYDFGGTCTSPHSTDMHLHCDCSSLVQQSFARAGVHMPRTAEDQWAWGEEGHAEVIPLGQAQPGDVVYFPTYLGPDIMGHTGIIVSPAKMIMLDAPQTGQPVQFGSYDPAGLPYGTHMLTVLRFVVTAGPGGTA